MSARSREVVAQRASAARAHAVASLQSLAGGGSLCAIARSGAAFPAGNYQEGRVAAAGVVLRLARREDLLGEELLARACAQWRLLVSDVRRGDRDWAAYGAGREDLLSELADDRTER